MKKVKLKKSSLKVLNDRVLIKPDAVQYQGASAEVTAALEKGKLVLPDAYEAFYKNLPDMGTIAGYGDKCRYPWVIGQKVQFSKMAGAKCKFNGDDYLIVREYDVNMLYEDFV